jgi:uncharacterized protein
MIRGIFAWLALLCALAVVPAAAAENDTPLKPSMTVEVPVRDGTHIFATIYLPKAEGKFPTLLAASAYRSDNVIAPESSLFLWRETGPIAYYVAHGYAYVHMDARGSGRSGGEYRYHDTAEQHDLYDVVEWIAKQPWSSGKVGGIGESYYAQEQWFLGEQNPPHLACIAPYDGNPDTYHFSAYQGGVPSAYPSVWYNEVVRAVNQWPAQGQSRLMNWDYVGQMLAHPLYDAFWQTRSAGDALGRIRVPVFSIGVWSKVDLHLDGNIVGFQRVVAPKKLLLISAKSVSSAAANYADPAFHERYLLPFYDWCLKGEATSYPQEPVVRYYVQGEDRFASSDSWPPAGVQYQSLYLSGAHSGTLHSLNDGSLSMHEADGGPASTSYRYPDPAWKGGVFAVDANGRPDPLSRKLTFVSEPLEKDMTVAGPIDLVLYASSSNRDTDFIVRIADQSPAGPAEENPNLAKAVLVSKGWLRASHRAIDPEKSTPHAPWYASTHADYLVPGQVYEFDVAVMPTAYRFRKGDRIRVEISNGDAYQTDFPFNHIYTPDKVGSDTIFHDAQHPSRLMLPLLPATD